MKLKNEFSDFYKHIRIDGEQLADAYNTALVPGTADDAYSREVLLAASEDYEDLLNIAGNGIMGFVVIPKISVNLPIYHGTDTQTLAAGVGHLLGSSLPVGGSNTHAVLTAHSGMSSQKMFSDIDELKIGDLFYLEVLGETLAYQVDQIKTVLPEDTTYLQIGGDEDFCTLVTCTPFGINTHRLLVRGERVSLEMDAEDDLLRSVEDTMAEIEFAMIDAELSNEVGAAQALYVMALYDYSSQPGFVSRLVSCFEAEQTDDQLIANVNAAFGTDITVQDFTNVMRNVRSRRIDTTLYVDCGTKNNLDLVQWAISAYQSRWGYVMGTFGQVLTVDLLEAKLQQLPDAIGPYEDYIRANYLGVRTADCIGLIKGYSWYDPETGNINYGSNGMPDVSADQIYAQAAEKGSMATMPEIPGILVHAPGHIGIYIGNGYAIEAMGTKYGVVKTAISSRNWTGWCKNPYINYIEETEEVEGV